MALSKQDADWAFNAYEAVLPRLPQAQFPDCYETAETLSDIAAHFDTFLLDSFGVLNIGATAIPGQWNVLTSCAHWANGLSL